MGYGLYTLLVRGLCKGCDAVLDVILMPIVTQTLPYRGGGQIAVCAQSPCCVFLLSRLLSPFFLNRD